MWMKIIQKCGKENAGTHISHLNGFRLGEALWEEAVQGAEPPNPPPNPIRRTHDADLTRFLAGVCRKSRDLKTFPVSIRKILERYHCSTHHTTSGTIHVSCPSTWFQTYSFWANAGSLTGSLLALFPLLQHTEYNCSCESWLIRGHYLLMARTGLREAGNAEKKNRKNKKLVTSHHVPAHRALI